MSYSHHVVSSWPYEKQNTLVSRMLTNKRKHNSFARVWYCLVHFWRSSTKQPHKTRNNQGLVSAFECLPLELRLLKAGFHKRHCRSRSGSRKCAYDQVKIENRSRKRSHKLDGIGVWRTRTFPFSSDSVSDSVAYDPVKTRLSESEAEAEEQTNYNAISQALWLVYSWASASSFH